VLAVTGLGFTFTRQRGAREIHLKQYGIGEVVEEEWSRPFSERIVLPVARWLGRISSRLTPGQVVESTQSRLVQAGKRTEAWFWGFFAMKAVGVVALPLLFVVAFTISRGEFTFGILPVLVCLVLVYLGWRIPDFWLDSAIRGRKKDITKGLPDVMDLLVVTIEAGMALEAALSMVGEKFTGPLAEEFGITVYEISLGKRRQDALRDMATRTGVGELTSFITALVRADQTGVGVGNVLRVQADSMRVRRRQRAQEQAQQAPVKMMIPLILFIFPSMFTVILGPALLDAVKIIFPNWSG
jgi:tight adherence protein C